MPGFRPGSSVARAVSRVNDIDRQKRRHSCRRGDRTAPETSSNLVCRQMRHPDPPVRGRRKSQATSLAQARLIFQRSNVEPAAKKRLATTTFFQFRFELINGPIPGPQRRQCTARPWNTSDKNHRHRRHRRGRRAIRTAR